MGLFGRQVNAVDSQGLTALHRVAKQGNVQASRLLIQYGADLNIASLQGYTAAQLAPESLQKILKGEVDFVSSRCIVGVSLVHCNDLHRKRTALCGCGMVLILLVEEFMNLETYR